MLVVGKWFSSLGVISALLSKEYATRQAPSAAKFGQSSLCLPDAGTIWAIFVHFIFTGISS
jgi:hypothetical protein